MSKKNFGKLISERIEMTTPNKDYFSVLLSDSELVHLISCLHFAKRHCYFSQDSACLDGLISYLNEFLNLKKL